MRNPSIVESFATLDRAPGVKCQLMSPELVVMYTEQVQRGTNIEFGSRPAASLEGSMRSASL